MQNDKICSDIVSALVTTRTEANILLSELDALLRSLYIVGPGNYDDVLLTGVRSKVALVLSQFVNDKNREEILNELKKQTESINYFGLTIAFEPNMEIISKIYNWVKQNVGPALALDITIDKRILGGAIIEYNGKVFKSILLTRIEEYFLINNVNL